MHLAKTDIPIRLAVPGATARQLPDFGDAAGTLGAEYFTLAAGTDIAPLLTGLADDLCHAPHWGYLLAGRVVVTYGDGATEHLGRGEVFFWPAGHTVRVDQDAELIMFSPQVEHGEVMDHMSGIVAAMG
jgi:hypothetical protein